MTTTPVQRQARERALAAVPQRHRRRVARLLTLLEQASSAGIGAYVEFQGRTRAAYHEDPDRVAQLLVQLLDGDTTAAQALVDELDGDLPSTVPTLSPTRPVPQPVGSAITAHAPPHVPRGRAGAAQEVNRPTT